MRRIIPAVCLVLLAATAYADEKAIEPEAVDLGRPVDFEKDVYPILDAKCLACHNTAISENGLNLEEVKLILKGGKRGPSVIAKDPEKSLLLKVSSRAMAPAMPPLPNKVEAAALTPKELGILKQWIVEGATEGMMSAARSIDWHPLPAGINPIYAVAMTPDGQYVACGRANKITIYHVVTGETLAELTDPSLLSIQYNGKPMYTPGSSHRDFVHALRFSNDGRTLASGSFREVKLWTRPDSAAKVNIAAGAAATTLAVSADGSLVAVAVADNSIKLFNVADGAAIRTITGHGAKVTGLAFTPDTKVLFSTSHDKSLRAWNVADGTPAGQIDTPAPANGLALSLDGKQAVTANADNLLRLWDVTTLPLATPPMPLKQMAGHGGPVTCVALVMPQGTQVVSGSDDGTVRVWDLASGNQAKQMGHGGPVTSVACRPDGQFFASASANNTAKLWNAGNSQQVVEIKGDNRAIKLVATLTADEAEAKANLMAATAAVPVAEKTATERAEAAKKAAEAKAAAEKTFTEMAAKTKTAMEASDAAKKAFDEKKDDKNLEKAAADALKAFMDADAASKKAEMDLKSATNAQTQADKSAKEATDAVATAKQLVETTTAKQKQAETVLNDAKAKSTEKEKPFRAVAFSRDGKEFAVAGELGTIATFDATTGVPFEVFDAHTGPIQALLPGAGKTLLSIGDDQTAKAWDLNPAWKLAGVLGPKKEAPGDLNDSVFVDRVLCLDFNADGSQLATGGGDPSRSGELMLWDVKNQALLKAFPDAHSDTVFGVEFSPDGTQLLSGAADKFVKIFDIATGNRLKSFEGHTNHVLDVSWKHDAKLIASAGADNAIKIWSVETGEQQRTIAGYQKQVTSLQFVGRGQTVLSCGGDKTVRFHQADNGNNFRNFGGATDYMFAVAASDDEKTIAAGGQDGILRLWNGTNAQPLKQFDPPKPPDANQQASAK